MILVFGSISVIILADFNSVEIRESAIFCARQVQKVPKRSTHQAEEDKNEKILFGDLWEPEN